MTDAENVNYWAHVSQPIHDDVISIRVNTDLPDDYKRKTEELGQTYFESIAVTDVGQAVQLSNLKFPTPIEDYYRMYPHVRDLCDRILAEDMKIRGLKADIDVDGDSDKVIKVLKEYVASPIELK